MLTLLLFLKFGLTTLSFTGDAEVDFNNSAVVIVRDGIDVGEWIAPD
jgi:hypothetical protein